MKRAFSAASLLVAMTVIGVLLVLTIPRLVSNIMNKSRAAVVQKTYLGITEAVKTMMLQERTSKIKKTILYKNAETSVEDSAGEFLKTYFKITTDCKTKTSPCFAGSYLALNKETAITLPEENTVYCVGTESNASICISPLQDDTNAVVYLDVNGLDAPNTAGLDYFVFYIYPNGYIGDKTNSADECYNSNIGAGCFKKLYSNNWVMDY